MNTCGISISYNERTNKKYGTAILVTKNLISCSNCVFHMTLLTHTQSYNHKGFSQVDNLERRTNDISTAKDAVTLYRFFALEYDDIEAQSHPKYL